MFTPIQLDKMRNFRYGMKALHLIEKTLNCKIGKLDFEDLSQYQIAVIVWAGLAHEDSKLTPDGVMDLIDEHSNIADVAQVMSQAIQDSFSSGSEGKKQAASPATTTS